MVLDHRRDEAAVELPATQRGQLLFELTVLRVDLHGPGHVAGRPEMVECGAMVVDHFLAERTHAFALPVDPCELSELEIRLVGHRGLLREAATSTVGRALARSGRGEDGQDCGGRDSDSPHRSSFALR
jgi:hypothetical protein